MPHAQTILQAFGEVSQNPVDFDLTVTTTVCEGMNLVYASFQALYVQYQKHHFVVQGSQFLPLHEFFQSSYEAVKGHAHDLAERLNGLGGIPAGSLAKLAELSCFPAEVEGALSARHMLENDLAAEQALIKLIRRQVAQAESVGDRASRYLYEQILLTTEERAFHLDHYLAADSLTLGLR
jgi:DNA-binding ferritin-like protein